MAKENKGKRTSKAKLQTTFSGRKGRNKKKPWIISKGKNSGCSPIQL